MNHHDKSGKQLWSVLVPVAEYLWIAGMFFLIELFAFYMLAPGDGMPLAFGAMWALLLSALVYVLPWKAGRILFGVLYYVLLLWTVAQIAFYQYFGKIMWITSSFYAAEGAAFLGDVIATFSVSWWLLSVLLIVAGIPVLIWFPGGLRGWLPRLFLILPAAGGILGLCLLPQVLFLRDEGVWGTHSEYMRSTSVEATYKTMYDAEKIYNMAGMYQLTAKDLWTNVLYPLTPAYQAELNRQHRQIDEYFEARGGHETNEMTGLFAGKNVVLVLMESVDDYMVTPEDTPTLYQLMEEGISFTDFYTPGYGSARTLNAEFCMNTGIYLPTTGQYVFNYVTNAFDQSIASSMNDAGYTSEVFHYNSGAFYSREVFEPAMGYRAYNSYETYTQDKNALYNDCLLFDIPELESLFFREGQTFNTIITRSAHLSYKYNEVLSNWGLKQYPQYRGLYGSEEEDCARLKARLVDDMFARLLQELEEKGQLDNTVIIGMTDHYTYGFKNVPELLELSDVEHELLLEKTPCFVWSPGGPSLEVDKTLNTADLLPTVLNLLGLETGFSYLGQDAFDPNYEGYAIFPDGSWIAQGTVWQKGKTLLSESPMTQEQMAEMSALAQKFIEISNLLLTSDYYAQ